MTRTLEKVGRLRYAAGDALATFSPHTGFSARHWAILEALSWGALSTRQLFLLCQRCPEPFANEPLLRRQLLRLVRTKLVARRSFARLTSGSTENYYQLTTHGYRLLFGPTAPLPSGSWFGPLALARQAHHRSVMEFLTHVAVAADRAGVEFRDLYPENSLTLSTGLEAIKPDAAFTLVSGRQEYRFYLEMDNATASLSPARSRDSMRQKIRVYEAIQDQSAERFRVLLVSIRPTLQRLANLRQLAATLAQNPQRSLCLTTTLDDFLAAEQPLTAATWCDHQERPQSLLASLSPWPAIVEQVSLTADILSP